MVSSSTNLDILGDLFPTHRRFLARPRCCCGAGRCEPIVPEVVVLSIRLGDGTKLSLERMEFDFLPNDEDISKLRMEEIAVIFIVLLMEEILHQLIGSLSHYLQRFLHPRWCRFCPPTVRLYLHATYIQMPFDLPWFPPKSLPRCIQISQFPDAAQTCGGGVCGDERESEDENRPSQKEAHGIHAWYLPTCSIM